MFAAHYFDHSDSSEYTAWGTTLDQAFNNLCDMCECPDPNQVEFYQTIKLRVQVETTTKFTLV